MCSGRAGGVLPSLKFEAIVGNDGDLVTHAHSVVIFLSLPEGGGTEVLKTNKQTNEQSVEKVVHVDWLIVVRRLNLGGR